jgi:hypothetical protein
MSEQLYIDFQNKEKDTPIDNRKVGVSFICFEDMLMNYSSDLKFSTSTSNWRKVQNVLEMGDYGGSLDPQYIIKSLDKINCEIGIASLDDPNCLDAIILKLYDIENGTLIFQKLFSIAVAAIQAKTKVRVMSGFFVGKI